MAQQELVSVETLKAITDAFNAHDLDAIMEIFAMQRTTSRSYDNAPRKLDFSRAALYAWPAAAGLARR